MTELKCSGMRTRQQAAELELRGVRDRLGDAAARRKSLAHICAQLEQPLAAELGQQVGGGAVGGGAVCGRTAAAAGAVLRAPVAARSLAA